MIVAFVKRYKIALAVVLVCLCFVACAAGGVYAYLSSVTDPLVNELVPAQVACRVEETFENGVKENVRIRNIGNVDAFVRVTVVINFVSEDGSKILAASPMEGTNYSIVWGEDGWQKGTDGYWYHKAAVASEDVTAPLIQTASVLSVPSGYRLHIQIIASALQSEPAAAVADAWSVTLQNGELIPQ